MPVKTKLESRILVDGSRTPGMPASFLAAYFEQALPGRDSEEPTPEELSKEVAALEERVCRHWDIKREEAHEVAVLIHHALTSNSEDFGEAELERYGLQEMPETARVRRKFAVNHKNRG